MSFFDLFKSKPAPKDLRTALFDAVARRDSQELQALCEQHQDEIRSTFPTWRTVPEPLRADPPKLQWYGQGLVAVAQLFEQAGDRSLVALLMGNQGQNPLMALQRDLGKAQALLDDGLPAQAARLLETALEGAAGLRGSGIDHYLPRLFGMLGVARFHAGESPGAVEATRKARDLCSATGDKEGVSIYSGNLARMEKTDTVLFHAPDGRALTVEELRGATGRFRYEVLGRDHVPEQATDLHQRARQAGSRGDHAEAMTLLKQASALAPAWPYPVYDMAFTHLLDKDFEGARAHYQQTLRLAPRGFFTAITALDTLLREESGDLPRGTYLSYLSLEWAVDPADRKAAAADLSRRVPTFAPVWKELATFAEDDEERLALLERGLAATPDPETKGTLLINKALVLDARGDRAAAAHILTDLARDPHSTYAVEHMARATLAGIFMG